MRALARFSEYPRVFTYFEVSTVDVVGIYFLSHVLALILLHHPPSVLRENAGGKEAARSSCELPVGNILEEIFLSSCAVKCDPSAIAIILSRLVDVLRQPNSRSSRTSADAAPAH